MSVVSPALLLSYHRQQGADADTKEYPHWPGSHLVCTAAAACLVGRLVDHTSACRSPKHDHSYS